MVCENVEGLRPVNPNSSFSAGPVYIWAQIKVPRSESIRLRWLTAGGEDLGSKTIDVEESPTYRIWDYRKCEPGSYVVEHYNSQNKLLAKRKFTVTTYHRVTGSFAGTAVEAAGGTDSLVRDWWRRRESNPFHY